METRSTLGFKDLQNLRPENRKADTSRLSCEPQGIPQNGLQIACALTIYFNGVICKLA